MKGDFSRFTFDESSPYSRVLMQQGRVLLDADWNESAEIQTYYLRTLASDLVGPHGAPATEDGDEGTGFSISKSVDDKGNEVKNDFAIAAGHYYVQGILCQNPASVGYRAQVDWPDDGVPFDAHPYLLYLDVWERHITPTETDDVFADPALGGADTCSRARVVWQVKVLPLDVAPTPIDLYKNKYQDFLKALNVPDFGRLSARVDKPADADSPCLLAPDSRYRGNENQLYRVEVRKGGPQPTFVWSRENGSEIYPVTNISGQVVTVQSGRDDRSQLQPDDRVDLVDDTYTLRNGTDPLLRVTAVNRETGEVSLDVAPSRVNGTHRYLRRWNSGEIDLTAASNAAANGWITLEDGVQVKFENVKAGFVPGQYWSIPVRTATGDVIWPQAGGKPVFREPQGIRHAYAPLAIASFKSDRSVDKMTDLRRRIVKLWK